MFMSEKVRGPVLLGSIESTAPFHFAFVSQNLSRHLWCLQRLVLRAGGKVLDQLSEGQCLDGSGTLPNRSGISDCELAIAARGGRPRSKGGGTLDSSITVAE